MRSRTGVGLALLSVGLEPAPFGPADSLAPDEREIRSLDLPGRNGVPRLLEELWAALRREERAVVFYPGWLAEPALSAIARARSLIDTARVATYGIALPPLAAGVLLSLAPALAKLGPAPGVLLAALRSLERELVTIAWLRSVRRLREPRPSVAQRVGSLLPRTAFCVCSAPEPAVRRLRRGRCELALPSLGNALTVGVAGRDDGIGWITDFVLERLSDAHVRRFPPTAAGAEWWRTRRVAEAVIYPTDLAAARSRLFEPLEPVECSWCGTLIAFARCPFCGFASGRQTVENLPRPTSTQTVRTLPRPTKTAPARDGAKVGKGEAKSRDELYQEARRLGIPGRSKMGKAELRRAISRAG